MRVSEEKSPEFSAGFAALLQFFARVYTHLHIRQNAWQADIQGLQQITAGRIRRGDAQSQVVIRAATPEDSSVCGQICYEAFSKLSAKHGFPCDFPGPEAATGLLSMLFSSPGFYCVVAESEGRIVGSNALDERSMVAGIGPITIDPSAQNLGVERKLMHAVMDRATERRPAGMRLMQAAYHNRSLSLYASLGFDVQEPLSCVQGRPLERNVPGCVVRQAVPSDLNACNVLVNGGSVCILEDDGAGKDSAATSEIGIPMKDTRKEDDCQKETSFTGPRAGDQDMPCIRISNERYAKHARFGDPLDLGR